MKMTMIRKAREEDAEFIYQTAEKEDAFKVRPDANSWNKNQIINWIDSENDLILVSENQGNVNGYIMAQLNRPTGKATIENIYVNENSRRKGIGSRLIEECLKQLKERGGTYICGMVKVNNIPSIKFFESLNFTKGYNFYWMSRKS